MPEQEKVSPISRIIQLIIAISGLYATMKSDFGSASFSEIFVIIIGITFLIFIVGLIDKFFRKTGSKVSGILANAFGILLFAFAVTFLVVMIWPKLAPDFYQSVHQGVFKIGVENAEDVIQEPRRGYESLVGKPYMTQGCWAGGTQCDEFTCPPPDRAGFKKIIIRWGQKTDIGTNKREAFCSVPSEYCDDPRRERCYNYYITEGCYVRTEWYEWYRQKCLDSNLPFTDAAVCQPQ